jgi:hypothetical protein
MRLTTRKLMPAAALTGATALIALGYPAGSRAQSVFCPTNIPDLANGACTNGTNGAFSGAALASQALSELSQTTTQQTTRNASDAVTARRAQEEERCD